jgi:hypothetical protein
LTLARFLRTDRDYHPPQSLPITPTPILPHPTTAHTSSISLYLHPAPTRTRSHLSGSARPPRPNARSRNASSSAATSGAGVSARSRSCRASRLGTCGRWPTGWRARRSRSGSEGAVEERCWASGGTRGSCGRRSLQRRSGVTLGRICREYCPHNLYEPVCRRWQLTLTLVVDDLADSCMTLGNRLTRDGLTRSLASEVPS